jgi:hypothetical protein
MAVIGWPPVLRLGHQGHDVGFKRVKVQGLKGSGIIKAMRHRVGQAGMLVQHLQIQLVWPPIAIGLHSDFSGLAAGVHYGAFALGFHFHILFLKQFESCIAVTAESHIGPIDYAPSINSFYLC